MKRGPGLPPVAGFVGVGVRWRGFGRLVGLDDGPLVARGRGRPGGGLVALGLGGVVGRLRRDVLTEQGLLAGELGLGLAPGRFAGADHLVEMTVETEALDATIRGDGGFGSTGRS